METERRYEQTWRQGSCHVDGRMRGTIEVHVVATERGAGAAKGGFIKDQSKDVAGWIRIRGRFEIGRAQAWEEAKV